MLCQSTKAIWGYVCNGYETCHYDAIFFILLLSLLQTSNGRLLFGKFGMLNYFEWKMVFCSIRSTVDFVLFLMFVDYFMLIVYLIYTIYMLWMRVLFHIIVWITRNVTDFLHVTNTIKRFPTHFQGHYQAQENDLVF